MGGPGWPYCGYCLRLGKSELIAGDRRKAAPAGASNMGGGSQEAAIYFSVSPMRENVQAIRT